MNYRVTLSDDAEADMDGLSPNTKSDVNAVFRRLRSGTDRRYDLQLANTDGLWRAHAGRRWRVVFRVGPGRQIEATRIRRRGRAYEGIEHPHRRDVRESEAAYEAPDLGTIEEESEVAS